MDDFSFWWYIIAAIIYFITRSKKKKEQPSRPGTEQNPPASGRPKTFEELLREITEGPQEESLPMPPKQEPVVIEHRQERAEERREGVERVFADDESRKVYEESIRMAEGADIKFERDEHFTPRLFKGDNKSARNHNAFADELRDGFDADEAKKAVIYAEIMNRRY